MREKGLFRVLPCRQSELPVYRRRTYPCRLAGHMGGLLTHGPYLPEVPITLLALSTRWENSVGIKSHLCQARSQLVPCTCVATYAPCPVRKQDLVRLWLHLLGVTGLN